MPPFLHSGRPSILFQTLEMLSLPPNTNLDTKEPNQCVTINISHSNNFKAKWQQNDAQLYSIWRSKVHLSYTYDEKCFEAIHAYIQHTKLTYSSGKQNTTIIPFCMGWTLIHKSSTNKFCKRYLCAEKQQSCIEGVAPIVVYPSKSAFEAMANWQDYDEDKCNDNCQDNQLYLHVLKPHLPPHLCPLLPEILCLQSKRVIYTT